MLSIIRLSRNSLRIRGLLRNALGIGRLGCARDSWGDGRIRCLGVHVVILLNVDVLAFRLGFARFLGSLGIEALLNQVQGLLIFLE